MSRRRFVQTCAAGAFLLTSAGLAGAAAGSDRRLGPTSRRIPLNDEWRFGGRYHPDATAARFADGGFERVTLPHCVASLSWQNWDPTAWQDVWLYRRHFTVPPGLRGARVFVQFEGVMVGTTPTINGHTLPTHLGGYLPSRYELTEHLVDGDNVLAVTVDSRWSNVPPEGAPTGAKRIDYLEPGGVHRGVALEFVPQAFIADVFAKPVEVLQAGRRVEVTCTVDAAAAVAEDARLVVELRDGTRLVARTGAAVQLAAPGAVETKLTLGGLGDVTLWDVEHPKLYEVVSTLLVGGQPVHDHRVRIGFREARFDLDGFHLNGRRLQLFGLNRHELYPYVGFAMPPRVMRRDAAMLRHDFNCNIVRCSHYPQTEAFLDACDELGLMVWQEVPGWGYLGDEAWKKLLRRDVREMVIRDRNHPAIVIWGSRVNESANDEALYHETKAMVRSLDDSRPTSGSMTPGSRKTWRTKWHEDVFAFDDYHAEADGSVGIADPVPGYPYLLAEAVGQFNYTARKGFDAKYRRAGDIAVQRQQALRHAQAHSRAGAKPRICGVIAWCAFDYSSLLNSYQNVKCPGIADTFRMPKLGAAFYLAQGDPKIRPVIQPDFYWDFGAATPRGPGPRSAIFSNCDRLEIFVAGTRLATLTPDHAGFPHLKHPPFFADLECDGASHPELRIDGYVGDTMALSRRFSADPAQDQLAVSVDDAEIAADGSDATRVAFKVVDQFGAERAFAGGTVTVQVDGPGVLIGDRQFDLAQTGGVGAVWVKSRPSARGQLRVTVRHSALGEKNVTVTAA